jgi:amino acid transporter
MMADVHKYDHSSEGSPERKYGQEVNIASTGQFEEDSHHHLHRGLKARQITMIAIGGAIGTGLIIGT